MIESEYFGHLERRISAELAGMPQKELRRLMCDGFLPEHYVITESGSHIGGRVYIEDGRGAQSFWNFVVLLGRQRILRESMNWEDFLPAENTTGWLFLDFERRFLKVKLSAAHLERAQATT